MDRQEDGEGGGADPSKYKTTMCRMDPYKFYVGAGWDGISFNTCVAGKETPDSNDDFHDRMDFCNLRVERTCKERKKLYVDRDSSLSSPNSVI